MSDGRFRSLPPPLRWFFLATVVNMAGSGALFGFQLIYFHEIRGISLGRAGIAMAAHTVAALIATPIGGSLSDHFGPRRTLAIGCAISVAAAASFGYVSNFSSALAASALLGVGNGLWYPSQHALLALIVTPAERPTVSALQRLALNLGAALGGMVGGFVVASGTLNSFRVLFGFNVATYLLFAIVLPFMPTGRAEALETPGGAVVASTRPTVADVLGDRFFVRLLITDLAVALGFGFLWAFTPVYAAALGISNAVIGVVFAIGALSVVITQIPTLRWVVGRRRMNWLVTMNLAFAVAFTLMTITSHVTVGAAIALIAVAQFIGGFGESILGAVRHPLTSDLAPDPLMGRYHGLATVIFQLGMGSALAIGGVVMDRSIDAVWFVPLAASLAGAASVWRIRHRIPRHLVLSA